MIKTLIFDFGNIFIDLNKEAIQKELKQLGASGFSEDMLQQNLSYEKGLISTQEFIDFYKTKFPESSENKLLRVWNSTLITIPEKRLEFIKELANSGEYKILMLSNTNDLHTRWAEKNIPFFKEFKGYFDKIYFSHEIKMRKPDKEIYEKILKENNLIPEETLFIDDLAENTEAAEKLGIHTWNLDPENQDVTQLFSVKSDLLN